MIQLAEDITAYLENNSRITGFTSQRLQEIIANNFSDVKGYEWRLLVVWSGLYVFQFEELYNVKIYSNDN